MATRRNLSFALDGFDARHMPTDESTSAYATTNFVTPYEFASSPTVDKIILIAPRNYNAAEGLGLTNITDILAMEFDAAQLQNTTTAVGYIRSPIIKAPEFAATIGYTSTRGRLHNLSAQIECLGTSTGLVPPGSVWFGSVPYVESTQYSGQGTKTLKEVWADDSISVGYLKSYSAAGLVQKPVRVHANVSETVLYKQWNDFVVPSVTVGLSTLRLHNALEPILLYVPRAGDTTTVVNYRLSLGQQWCSRWPNDPTIRATQQVHPPTSPSLWSEATSMLREVGGTFANAAALPMGSALGRRIASEYGPAVGTLA